MSLYQVLQVDKNASEEDIRRAYKKLAVQLHPDKNPGREEDFKRAAAAYEVLSDPERRRVYDATGSTEPRRPSGPHAGDTGGFPFPFPFASFFGGRGGQEREQPEAPTLVKIPMSMEDIVFGFSRHVEVVYPDTCGECEGRRTLDPAGGEVECPRCGGTGRVVVRMGPLHIQSTCEACGGKGRALDPRKHCAGCRGRGRVPVRKRFELTIPKGTRHGTRQVACGGKVEFLFAYDIDHDKYEIDKDGKTVHVRVALDVFDVLRGFQKSVVIYGKDTLLVRDGYRDPNRPFCIPGMGIDGASLVVHFVVIFPEALDGGVQERIWEAIGSARSGVGNGESDVIRIGD